MSQLTQHRSSELQGTQCSGITYGRQGRPQNATAPEEVNYVYKLAIQAQYPRIAKFHIVLSSVCHSSDWSSRGSLVYSGDLVDYRSATYARQAWLNRYEVALRRRDRLIRVARYDASQWHAGLCQSSTLLLEQSLSIVTSTRMLGYKTKDIRSV